MKSLFATTAAAALTALLFTNCQKEEELQTTAQPRFGATEAEVLEMEVTYRETPATIHEALSDGGQTALRLGGPLNKIQPIEGGDPIRGIHAISDGGATLRQRPPAGLEIQPIEGGDPIRGTRAISDGSTELDQ